MQADSFPFISRWWVSFNFSQRRNDATPHFQRVYFFATLPAGSHCVIRFKLSNYPVVKSGLKKLTYFYTKLFEFQLLRL